MKRTDDEELVLCLHCRRVRHPDEPGWEEFDIQATRLFLCPLHAPAFCLGLDWGDRRSRIAATQAAPPEENEPKADAAKQQRRRLEARLRLVYEWNMTPTQIHAELSRWVAGQDEAKRILATALRSHYGRVRMRMDQDGGRTPRVNPDMISKDVPLVIGPTGCGKTLLLRSAAKLVSVPWHSVSLVSFTEEGFVGDSVGSILSALLPPADNYRPLAEVGIVFLDELCKKARRVMHGSRDVSGEGAINGLLAMLDTHGSKIHVPSQVTDRRSGSYVMVEFDTKDTFFVLGGAFAGLAEIIAADLGGRRRMGFGAAADTPRDAQLREAELLHMVQPHHIAQYGFSEEFCGRIGPITVVDPLSREDLRTIMCDLEDAVVKMNQARAQLEGFDLEFTPEAVDAICEQAYQSGMGARRLRSLTSEVVRAIFFGLPQARAKGQTPRVVVTAATLEDPSSYEVVRPRRTTAPAAPSDVEGDGGEPPRAAVR